MGRHFIEKNVLDVVIVPIIVYAVYYGVFDSQNKF